MPGRETDIQRLAATLPAGDFELTPTIVAAIDALARAGRRDPAARNALYAAFNLKIARFLAPYRLRATAAGDFADIEQEAFLVFADLVTGWRGEGVFAHYFLGFFPWRLRHVVERYERRWPREPVLASLDARWSAGWSMVAQAETCEDAMLDELLARCGPLTVEERWLLQLHLLDERPLVEVAAVFGWSRRTVFRRWRKLRERLDAVDGATPAAGGRQRAS